MTLELSDLHTIENEMLLALPGLFWHNSDVKMLLEIASGALELK